MSRLTSDTQLVSDAIAVNVSQLMSNGISCTGTLVMMCKCSWNLVLLDVVAVPIVLMVAAIYGGFYSVKGL